MTIRYKFEHLVIGLMSDISDMCACNMSMNPVNHTVGPSVQDFMCKFVYTSLMIFILSYLIRDCFGNSSSRKNNHRSNEEENKNTDENDKKKTKDGDTEDTDESDKKETEDTDEKNITDESDKKEIEDIRGLIFAKLSPKDYSRLIRNIRELCEQIESNDDFTSLSPEFDEFSTNITYSKYKSHLLYIDIENTKGQISEIEFDSKSRKFNITKDGIPYQECIKYINTLVDYFREVENYLKDSNRSTPFNST